MLGQPLRRPQVDHAEPARVDEPQERAVVEGEGEVLVRAAGLAVEHQPAGHAKMQEQDRAVVEKTLDVLGPAGEAEDGSALDALAQAIGQREADVGATLDQASHPPAGQARRQGPHGGLDLRQFRHRGAPAERAVAGIRPAA